MAGCARGGLRERSRVSLPVARARCRTANAARSAAPAKEPPSRGATSQDGARRRGGSVRSGAGRGAVPGVEMDRVAILPGPS
jgi:hypothetical protein